MDDDGSWQWEHSAEAQRLRRLMEANPEKVKEIERQLTLIKKGKSTGSAAKDFELSHFAMHLLEDKHPITDLEAKVKEGEPVLVVNIEDMPSCHRFYSEATQTLAIARGSLEFDNKGFSMTIPAERHVRMVEGNSGDHDWSLHEGNILILGSDLYRINRPIREWHEAGFGGKRGNTLHLYAGQDDVEAQFRTREGIDPSYADALHLLGANVPEPFAKAWEEHRVTTIYGMIDDIEKLRLGEARAREKIDAVRQQVGRNEFIETDVDAFFMSYGDHEKREEATRRLKSILERARKMGLHEEQRTLPGRMPGTKIDVAEYFRERCRQYKVDS